MSKYFIHDNTVYTNLSIEIINKISQKYVIKFVSDLRQAVDFMVFNATFNNILAIS
jgi:hypothetical protein